MFFDKVWRRFVHFYRRSASVLLQCADVGLIGLVHRMVSLRAPIVGALVVGRLRGWLGELERLSVECALLDGSVGSPFGLYLGRLDWRGGLFVLGCSI